VRCPGRLSLAYFSLAKQREVSRPPPRWAKPREAPATGERSDKPWIPARPYAGLSLACRRAGMTKSRTDEP
jgi:hypothetical protein